jgi:hypothetical protein
MRTARCRSYSAPRLAGRTEDANTPEGEPYFPNSSRTYQAMADLKNANGDKSVRAIQDLVTGHGT